MLVPIDQIRLVTFNDEEIGMGFNSQSGDAVGTPFVGDCKPSQSQVSSGQVVDASIQILTSQEELMSLMNMSFQAQGRYGCFSGSAKANFSENTKYNSSSTFLVARCVVKNPITRGREFVLREDAANLLKSSPPRNDDFYAAYGDSFVRGLQTGGEFYAVIRITSKSSSTQSKLSTTLQAEFNSLSASGSFKASFAEANKSTKTESEYTATMFQVSGSGIETAPTCTVEEVLQRYKAFPSIAKNSPVAYQTELATYNTVPIPLPCYEEEESYLEALRDTRGQKLFYIQKRNDLEFALRNPSFFISLPNQSTLVGAIDLCTKYINALVHHAIQLSKGRVSSENFFFDPEKVLPPIQRPSEIPLTKVDSDLGSSEVVRIPDFSGTKGYEFACINSFLNGELAFNELSRTLKDSGTRDEIILFIEFVQNKRIEMNITGPFDIHPMGCCVFGDQSPKFGEPIEPGETLTISLYYEPMGG